MNRFLVFRVGERLCGLPLEHVRETFRPLPIEPLPGAPRFVLGLTIARGIPVPVVDASMLILSTPGASGRFVALELANRNVVLAVEEVVGVRAVSAVDLPPLLEDVGKETVAAVGTLDAELLTVLRTATILSLAEIVA